MPGINWLSFGLRKNPFDIQPLLDGGDIPVSEAFVGRERERAEIESTFLSVERSCIAICGRVGVGKTTLTNFIKYSWKHGVDGKVLFSARSEIQAQLSTLNARSFLLEIIGAVITEIRLIEPQMLTRNDLLKKLTLLVDVTQSAAWSGGLNASVAGFGGGVNLGRGGQPTQPLQYPMVVLFEYFKELIQLLITTEINGKRYLGLIVHMNNFDIVNETEDGRHATIAFFNEIRDILQTESVYFMFLGPPGFFKDVISKDQRVKAIFRSPLAIDALAKTEVVEAITRRLKALTSPGVVRPVVPFTNEVIFALYELYEGDTRSILSSLSDIFAQTDMPLSKPVDIDEALYLLARERRGRIKGLSTAQENVLEFIITHNGPVTQKEISQQLGKAANNISGYYFSPLKDMGIIEEVEKVGKNKYWDLTRDYMCLRATKKLQAKVEKAFEVKSNQLNLL